MSAKFDSLSSFAAVVLISTFVGHGMPARKTIVTIPDAEGKEIRARLYGDENFHFYVSEDDGSLLLRKGDVLYPATLSDDGLIMESAKAADAHRLAPRLNNAAKAQKRISGLVEGTTFPASGKQKVAVVLVEYQDVKFNLSDPLDYFSRMLNEENFSDYHATGSARDWFLQSSNGLFEPEFDVYGPITLQQTREYYGAADAYNHDANPQKMVIEACRQLNADVDFTQYDRDHDGYIDNVFVVYAGRGEASGGSSDCVWPHAWKLSNAEPGTVYSFDGVRLDRYACSNEWELSELGYGYRPVGIGTFVHEFSHVMGLPDLYSTEYVNGSFTAGEWSALDYGPYNNDGCTPPQYSAWERAALGFIKIQPLSKDASNLALPPLTTDEAYMLPTESPDEYFIIENRRQKGWDEFIPGHGMLVWHIDYDAQAWTSNRVNNNPAHNRVDIVEADGTQTNASRSGDSFPGTGEVDAFSDLTSPALVSWSGKSLGYAFSEISERDSNILLRVNGGKEDIATPDAVNATDIHAGYFTVNWNAVTGATGYTVRVYNESFAEIAELAAGADDTMLKVGGLEPSTDYVFTVCAEDGIYGSLPSVPLSVRTLDPTFDYFAPTALGASGLTETSFTANWEAMEGAKEYFITVYSQEEAEGIVLNHGFADGGENLPEGWYSTSRASYGMASYSGEDIPALRLSKDGDYLEIACGHHRGETLSFWHRGNGTGETETLSVYTLSDKGIQLVSNIEIETAKGGKETSITLPEFELDSVRITFNRPDKGAVAIDDVKLTLHGEYYNAIVVGYDGRSAGGQTSLNVSNLTEGRIYFYDVYAYDGMEYTSRRSELVKVDLSDLSGTSAPEITGKLRISGRTVSSETPFDIYDISGRIIARNATYFDIPAAGIYIVTSKGCVPAKIAVY